MQQESRILPYLFDHYRPLNHLHLAASQVAFCHLWAAMPEQPLRVFAFMVCICSGFGSYVVDGHITQLHSLSGSIQGIFDGVL